MPTPAQIQRAIRNTLYGPVNRSGEIRRALINSKGKPDPVIEPDKGHYIGLDRDTLK